jgi:hypothetical protein
VLAAAAVSVLQLLLLPVMHMMQLMRLLPFRRCASVTAISAQQESCIDGLPAYEVLNRLSMFALICAATRN